VATAPATRARGPNALAARSDGAGIQGGRAGLGPHRARNLRLITVWRICKKARLADAFDGRGAAEYPGRWNNPGVAVVYTAESRSLASLEVLVHAEDTRLLAAVQWVTIPVDIDERLIEIAKHLPEDWRELPAPPSTRDFGTQWVMQARSPVLRVSSIVVDGEFNYILNPRHADFGQLKIGASAPFSFDPRL
jgi:RES domain-containing protein